MCKLLRQLSRPMANMLMVALAVVSSAECLAIGLTPEQKACCAAMQHDCGRMAIESSCCANETHDDPSVAATKPSAGFVPVAALFAILTAPSISLQGSPRFAVTAETSSPGPPGVPTYLFVSSFRI